MSEEDKRPIYVMTSSTNLKLYSVLFEQACIDLGIPPGDARRDSLRQFGMRVFDLGVESSEAVLRRERARAEYAEAQIKSLQQKEKDE